MSPLSSPPTAPAALVHLLPPPFEVADIVRAYGAAFRATHQVSHEQTRVLRAIAQCRTAALGGHVEHCVSCGTERVCYDSCRNRHCPKVNPKNTHSVVGPTVLLLSLTSSLRWCWR